jgi:hypothetical protein
LINLEEIIQVPYSTKPSFKIYDGSILVKNSRNYLSKMSDTWTGDIPWEILRDAQDILRARYCKEDIAIMYNGRLQFYIIKFPSNWDPVEKQGMTFAEIHCPIPDSDALQKSSNKINDIMSKDKMYHRYVWSLETIPTMSCHPSIPRPEAKSFDDYYFRWEHQKTFPIRYGVSWGFTIDVNVVPLTKIMKQDFNHRIQNSINSMSDDVLTYKNLHKAKELYNEAK